MQVEEKNSPGKGKLVQVLGIPAERTPKLTRDCEAQERALDP